MKPKNFIRCGGLRKTTLRIGIASLHDPNPTLAQLMRVFHAR